MVKSAIAENQLPHRTAWGMQDVPLLVQGTTISTVVLRRDSRHIRPRDQIPLLGAFPKD